MSTLTEIRLALAEALNDLPERKSISLAGGNYDESTEKFVVRILVGDPSEEGDARLDELLAPEGPQSICELLERDPTLNGVISAVAVRSHSGHRAFKRPDGSEDLGTEFVLEVYRESNR